MIRTSRKSDIERILRIWLEVSSISHDFMPSGYWASKVNDMRHIYLPSSENYVYEKGGKVLGFISIIENNIAAIFVAPKQQGNGIGSKLIEFVKDKYRELHLSVYKTNTASISFYKKHGFSVEGQQIDENTGYPEISMKFNSYSSVGDGDWNIHR